MRSECMQAVAQAIGRSITQQEALGIESRIAEAMKNLARQDPAAWRALDRASRLRAAAKLAGKDVAATAAKKRQRVALTILAHDRVMSRYGALTAEGMPPHNAVAKILQDASQYAKGVSNEYFASLIDTFEAVSPRFLGMVENSRQAADLVREIFGEASGNPLAAKGARAWLDTVEAMRQRFNAAGGDMAKLDYGYLPQPHDEARVRQAGREKWMADTLPMLDRSRYVDTDGRLLNDAEMADMLGKVWDTLSTGGLNKVEPGRSTGNGMRANSGSEHRVIHFKDAASYTTYAASYNRGGVLAAMQGHVSKLANDIALVEEFGPNPNVQFRYLNDLAKVAADGEKLVGPFLVRTTEMWDVLNGASGSVANVRLAEIAQGMRNVEVFGKLGSALISSITDVPTYFATTGFNRLGFVDSLTNLVRSFGADTADYANRAGLVAESIISDMNRWAESNVGKGWTGKLANATMKASLLTAWTDAVRRGFSITQMGALGKLSRQGWRALDTADRTRLEAKGVTETDFKVWQLAAPENWHGSQMLTMQSVRALSEADLSAAGLTLRDQNRAISRLLGVIADESEFASVGQDLYTRAAVTRGTQKGTVHGEFLRSLMLFKGFPLAMISRHWGRMADQWRRGDKASSVAYGAALTTGLTIFGALAVQMKDIINGKDPRDMAEAKFWGAAFAQGGGVGIFGDLLYTGMGGENRAGLPNWMNLGGPVIGSAFEAIDLTFGNVGQAVRGEDTRVGAEALRFARSHMPFVNLWYAKGALDHAVLHDIQEYLSPGYQSRMRQRARKDWGQDFWWRPGEGLPRRAPDLEAAIGG